MDVNNKSIIIKSLRSYIANIESLRQTLFNIDGADEARRMLMMTKFEMLNTIHEISWIGLDRNIVENVVEEVEVDNPSADHIDYTA